MRHRNFTSRQFSYSFFYGIGVTLMAFSMASRTEATVINFEDSPVADYHYLNNGYGGLQWNNFALINSGDVTPSGYNVGAVSPPWETFDGGGTAASFGAGGVSTFTLNSFWMTSAWLDGLAVSVVAYDALGAVLDSTTLYPSATAPTFYTLNYAGINSVTFTPYGGTVDPAYGVNAEQFALDNVTINVPVPEPKAVSILALGGAGLLSRRRVVCR